VSSYKFDVVVVGAGHAGVEAALAAARLGVKTALLTNNLARIAYMSCNPSIGGLGKGHMVREIDALGGLMGMAADKTTIQFKRLNSRKGPAVRGSRSQCDKDLYSQFVADWVSKTENLTVLNGEASKLRLVGNKCVGVETTDSTVIEALSVVITTGTFMKAVMHFGLKQVPGGRIGDDATGGISDQLSDFGFRVTRLKTGTPPRLAAESIDWSKFEAQGGDERFVPFSVFSPRELALPQIDCYLGYTNERTHEVIRSNLHQSPMFTGVIEGIGPRYCPSIEDKITRFHEKDRHQTFLEPEGLNTNSIYLQGISTSLPEVVQYEFLHTIEGFEKVKILKPAYAVEYDFIEPTQIQHSLETRLISGLFLAGQINGTSGYEEAAAQGLIAGTNAANQVLGKDEFSLYRDEAYMGVLVDDLVTKGTKEPYRMMTSRAEHRLVLREDNVLERLAQKGFRAGLLSLEKFEFVSSLLAKRSELRTVLEGKTLVPDEATQQKLRALNTAVLQKPQTGADLLRRPEIHCSDLRCFDLDVSDDEWIYEPVEIEIKYEGYIKRQLEIINQAQRLEKMALPSDLNFGEIRGLSSEEVEKLKSVRPRSLAQAQRISGVNPSAIQAILIHLKGKNRKFGEL
jgi:tRNA uridine 5-carboxymethylaminomethyl modification enzyme